MGQQSSTGKNAIPPEDVLKITKILSESPQFEVASARRVSSKRASEKGLRLNEFLSERQISIREANEAIDFVHDFVLLYSAPLQNGANLNTNPLMAIHNRALASSDTLGDSNQQNLYSSVASSGGMNNKQKLLRNKVKSIIQNTEQSAVELKTVLTDMNTQQKSRFSFARQRMDFHREPAKLAKAVGSGKLHESSHNIRENFGSQNNSLNLALQARGVMRSSGVDESRDLRNGRSRNSPEKMREKNAFDGSRDMRNERSRYSPEQMREIERFDGSRNVLEPMREASGFNESRDMRNGRSRNSPDPMREAHGFNESRDMRNERSRNSPEQMKRVAAPVFGEVIRESREYRDDKTYESIRREKKERDNKTHESLLVLKDDIDRIKGDLQRSKSNPREPRRSGDRPINRDGSPGLSSYQGLTRDTKNVRNDPYENKRQPQYEQQQPRYIEPAAANVYSNRQGGGYQQPPPIKIPPQYNTAGIDVTQSQNIPYSQNMNYSKKQTFGKDEDPGRGQIQQQYSNQPYYENNGRPKSPLTADFAAYKRNEYEKQTLARSQTPAFDSRGNPESYRDQGLAHSNPNIIPQNRIQKQVINKIDNNRYLSDQVLNGERDQGPNNYGQMYIQKNRSDNYNSRHLKNAPPNQNQNQFGHPNLLNLLSPQKNNNKPQNLNDLNTPRSKHNFSGIVSDVNGSYSFDDDNEVQPVSINLNLEDLLNDSQIQINNNNIPQKSKGYQQPPQANYSKGGNNRNDQYYQQPSSYPNQNQKYQNNYPHDNYNSNNNFNTIPKTVYASSSGGIGYQGQNRQERNYDPRQQRNQGFDNGDNTGPNALFNLSESMIAKNDAYTNRSIERDEPVRRSKWDVNPHGAGYNSARGQLQSNYNYASSGQSRKY